MLEESNNIDGLFSDGLRDINVQPSEQVWSNISGKLVSKKRNMIALYIKTGLAASIALLVSFGGYNYFQMKKEIKPKFHTDVFDQANFSVENTAKSFPVDDVSYNTKQISAGENRSKNYTIEYKKKSPEILNTDLYIKQKPIGERTVDYKLCNTVYNHALDDKIYPKIDKESISLAKLEAQLIAMNIVNLKKEKAKEKQNDKSWSFIGQVGSSYVSNSKSNGGKNSNETGIWAMGGGVKLHYNLNKKIAIQAGIKYSKFGQNIKSQTDESYSQLAGAFIQERDMNITTNNAYRAPLRTSAGEIQLKREQALNKLYGIVSDFNFDQPNSSLTQSFEALEIPFLLRYNIKNAKLGLYVSAGLNASIIVGNGVYDNGSKVGSTKGIRKNNFNSQFSLGLEYKITEKFLFGVEPLFKYYINSVNKASEYNYTPYSIGFQTGIRYNF
ncbi:MAG: PorT family protein [Marinifilaceae bacterium]|jgi:opacity protein-like surface antigen|nr:PorT family protein [Marinifilaceae bacterium]